MPPPRIRRSDFIRQDAFKTWAPTPSSALPDMGTIIRIKKEAKAPSAKYASRAYAKTTRRYMLVVCEAFVKFLREKLSIPVQFGSMTSSHSVRRRLKNGKSITYQRTTTRKVIIRSQPGEYPRKETGSLQASVSFKVRISGTNVYATVGFIKNQLLPFPAGHPGRGKWTKRQPPSFYSMILEFRKHRKLLIEAWSKANQSGLIRRAVVAAGFKYVPGTEKMIKFPSFSAKDSFGELQPVPEMRRWMEVDRRKIEKKFAEYATDSEFGQEFGDDED